jgi:hypothetical protein
MLSQLHLVFTIINVLSILRYVTRDFTVTYDGEIAENSKISSYARDYRLFIVSRTCATGKPVFLPNNFKKTYRSYRCYRIKQLHFDSETRLEMRRDLVFVNEYSNYLVLKKLDF